MRHSLAVSLRWCHPVHDVPAKLPEAVHGAVSGSCVGNPHQVTEANPRASGIDESIKDNAPL
ncbi:hypothetical protein N9953_03035 [Akkermansiaceae bacterium]|nr:hypothetical protein [Akkermansiaceae bacterium]